MARSKAFKYCLCLLFIWTAVAALLPRVAWAQQPTVIVLPVQGIIGPATSDYLLRGLDTAAQRDVSLVIIQLDTPGGLDPSMRAIVQGILASPVPVATFVSPRGARAASAGTFILYASHIAAMTPASNLGAASPVSIGLGGASDPDGHPSSRANESSASESPQDDTSKRGDQNQHASQDVMAGKVTNDAAAYIRSLAQLRGRNIEFAEHAVLDAASMSSHEALEQGVIEYVATDIPGLLKQLDGVSVTVASQPAIQLHTTNAQIEHIDAGWRVKVLEVLTNPQVALVLMMIGIYGLFFELTSPGFALPGVAGAICLILGLYSFHMLPVNWTGVALLFIGTAMMVAEVFIPSFGALGIGGIVAFVLGGLFLTDTGIPQFDLTLPFLIGIAVASALLIILAGTLATRSLRAKVITGTHAMLGLNGTVVSSNDGVYYAHIRGERWQVVSKQPLSIGDRVEVVAMQGLTLQVRHETPATQNATTR